MRVWPFCLTIVVAASFPNICESKPNILFILTEDQGAHLSFVGTPGLSTPNMDRIAKAGVYFECAFVNYPVCSPSKAGIYTGTHCVANGLRGVTVNWHGPAETMPRGVANHRLTKLNRIGDEFPTMIELLKSAGYTCAITSKLHVHPVSKFPYDYFIKGNPTRESVRTHFAKAGNEKVPLFYLANISQPHRPFRNSDKVDIDIDVDAVEPPPFLPDTPVCRKDWAEYLGHCQLADRHVGNVLAGLEDSGQKENTIVIFMGDHGPAYHRGKLALYDFGIRVPLAFSGPMIRKGFKSDEMVSNVDLLPTLLDLAGLKELTPKLQHGHSIAPFLRGEADSTNNEFIYAEIDHGTYRRDDGEGMQERCIYDGRWKLIYRENRTEPRQVNADLKYFHHPNPKAPYQGNRVYDEIVKRREEFPEAFRLLARIDNEVLMSGESLPIFELYDRRNDLWEMKDLSGDPDHRDELKRLLRQLQKWSVQTDDDYTVLKSLSADTDTLFKELSTANSTNPADHWVATDALGRSLPAHSEAGDRRPGKQVGVFYFVWNGNHTQKVYDNSQILQQPEGDRKWGPPGATHFSSEPEYGYFHSSDPWVIRRDMQMLANAGVDFIYLNTTNALLYEKTVEQLLKVIRQMRDEGIGAPQVSFVTNAASGRTMNRAYDHFYTDPAYKGMWYEWQGKPLIFGIADDPVLRKEVAEYFTIKRCWAWTAAKTKPNHWQWLDTYPQDYGWSSSPDVPDQIPVSTSSHASNSMGKSFANGTHPPVRPDYTTEHTHRGLHFEEQWKRAHEVDPKVVMITQWNEWIAGRFIKKNERPVYAGRPAMKDGTWFVDVFSPEFSRDIAPMKGGHTDNYYYQMVSHIRRFKGMSAPNERPRSREIEVDGKFDDWKSVPVIHLDPAGDTMHRSFRGTDPKTIYMNKFGRNDIRSARVVEGKKDVHCMVSTTDNLTPHTDKHWMVLLIDRDQKKLTGWEGYDLAVNWKVMSQTKSTCAKWEHGKWQPAGEIEIAYRGRNLELSIPNEYFARETGQGFDFKWSDNASLTSVESLFLEGDVAPDRRFCFRY